jgi:hypothetical protein
VAAVAIGQSRTEQNTRAVVTLDKDAGRETREGLGQHGVPGPVVPRGEQRAGRPSGRRMVLCGRGGHTDTTTDLDEENLPPVPPVT